jgi:hypothetical protein
MPVNIITATASDTYNVGAVGQFSFDVKVHYEALERPCKIGGVRTEWDFRAHSVGWSVDSIGSPQVAYFHKPREDCVSRDGIKGMMDEVHVQLDFMIAQKVGVPYWTPFTGGGVAGVTLDTKHVSVLVIISADGAVSQKFRYREH